MLVHSEHPITTEEQGYCVDQKIHKIPLGIGFGLEPGISSAQYIYITLSVVAGSKVIGNGYKIDAASAYCLAPATVNPLS